MPVYCEPLSDEKIIKGLEGAKSVFIIGCGACANISYNIYNGAKEPFANIMKKPLSILKEVNRLEDMLTEKGFKVDSEIKGVLCVQNKKFAKLSNKINQFDALLVLSCKGGINTVSTLSNDKKIVAGMQLKGFKSIKPQIKGLHVYVKTAV